MYFLLIDCNNQPIFYIFFEISGLWCGDQAPLHIETDFYFGWGGVLPVSQHHSPAMGLARRHLINQRICPDFPERWSCISLDSRHRLLGAHSGAPLPFQFFTFKRGFYFDSLSSCKMDQYDRWVFLPIICSVGSLDNVP